MVGGPNRTPRRAVFLALILAPVCCGYIHAQVQSTSLAEKQTELSAGNQKAGAALASDDILNMDIDQLAKAPVVVPSMDIPVTSVAKEESTVGRSAAAVFVITNEMIRRSGATCIPEALRMAPGMEVAQVNSNTWAVSVRGVNHPYTNMLLVLIDGRSVYNPDFSGVLWNMQDVLLEDVERIEIIRGPGGTLWGANAMNGVINIITKKAKDTQGVYAAGGGGTYEKMFDAFRYGGQIGRDFHYRIYGKYFERGAYYDPSGLVDDAWRQGRVGFRSEYEPGRDGADVLTIQGDHFVGSTDNGIVPADPQLGERQTGQNLLVRWRHVYDEDSDWSLQAYYDMFMRDNVLQTECVKTLDVEFQYRFLLADRHKITCGGGFRNVVSDYYGGDQFTVWFPSPYWTTNYTNQFVQDEIQLIDDRLFFTIGCKLEQNPYTGLEYQPTARVLYAPDRRHSVWGAISRAVRTPNRVEEQADVTFPALYPDVYPRLMGNPAFESEVMYAYELGYRAQATKRFSWDVAAYYNYYDRFLTHNMGAPFVEVFPLPPHMVVPLWSADNGQGYTCGVELATNYTVTENWRLYAQYTYLYMNVHDRTTGEPSETGDPKNQVFLRSTWDIGENVGFDLMARYVDNLAVFSVPSYITMDLRLAWRPREHMEIAVVGQNLLDGRHWEFAGNRSDAQVYATEVVRGVYGTITLRR